LDKSGETSNKEIKSVFLVSRFTFDVSRALQRVMKCQSLTSRVPAEKFWNRVRLTQ